jgi:hypothetical protein
MVGWRGWALFAYKILLKIQSPGNQANPSLPVAGYSNSTNKVGTKGKPLAPQNLIALGRWSSSAITGNSSTNENLRSQTWTDAEQSTLAEKHLGEWNPDFKLKLKPKSERSSSCGVAQNRDPKHQQPGYPSWTPKKNLPPLEISAHQQRNPHFSHKPRSHPLCPNCHRNQPRQEITSMKWLTRVSIS